MKKVLVAGFETFNKAGFNPVHQTMEKLEGVLLKGGKMVTCAVPFERLEAINAVIAAIEEHKPYFVISLAQATGQKMITTEHMAFNQDIVSQTSSDARPHCYKKIEEDGPDAYFSTFPIADIAEHLQRKGIPCLVSNTAGSFISNYLFYRVQHFLRDTDIGHGFIHIPAFHDKNAPLDPDVMPLEQIIEGLITAAQAILDKKESEVIKNIAQSFEQEQA